MNNKIKKTILSSAVITGFALIGSILPMQANAQWLTYDQQVEKAIGGLIAKTDTGNNLTKTQIEQSSTYQQTTDARERRAIADTEIINKDMAAMPTIQKCAEVTRAQSVFGGGGSSGGGSGGGSPRSSTAPGGAGAQADVGKQIALQQINTKTKVGAVKQVLEGKSGLGTCVGTMKIDGCGGDGTHPGADRDAMSIYFNVDTTKAKNVETVSGGSAGSTKILTPANVSLDGKGIKIASNFISKLVGFMPESLSEAQAKEAGPYQAMWEIFQTRSSFVKASLTNVLGWRTAKVLSPEAKSYWASKSSKYSTYFPDYNAPVGEPSELEFLRLLVQETNEEAMKNGEDDIIAIGAKSAALNNVLMVKSLEKQDFIIGLLAASLSAQINPVDKQVMETEKEKYSQSK